MIRILAKRLRFDEQARQILRAAQHSYREWMEERALVSQCSRETEDRPTPAQMSVWTEAPLFFQPGGQGKWEMALPPSFTRLTEEMVLHVVRKCTVRQLKPQAGPTKPRSLARARYMGIWDTVDPRLPGSCPHR
jgi:hypothetical protein